MYLYGTSVNLFPLAVFPVDFGLTHSEVMRNEVINKLKVHQCRYENPPIALSSINIICQRFRIITSFTF